MLCFTFIGPVGYYFENTFKSINTDYTLLQSIVAQFLQKGATIATLVSEFCNAETWLLSVTETYRLLVMTVCLPEVKIFQIKFITKFLSACIHQVPISVTIF
jgi:histone deacetylase complex regulatory component SIN3